MSTPSSPRNISSPYPYLDTAAGDSGQPVDIDTGHSTSSASSIASSASESEYNGQSARPVSTRRPRMDRPRLADRQRSYSIIIPKGMDTYQRERPQYPPTDARAMSPRRSSMDLERLEQSARQSLKDQARTLQSSLAALAERIDEVKSDHDKLENENRFLQDYIGGLTRTMSTTGLGRSGSTAKKGRK